MQTNFQYLKSEVPEVLGKNHGYQHLYKEASAILKSGNLKFTWLLNNKFYTYSAVASSGDEIIFGRIGANDPDYNLRHEPTLIIRKKDAKDALFVSTIEPHGSYSPVSELAVNAYSNIEKLEVVYNSTAYTAVEIAIKSGGKKLFIIANQNNDKNQEHHLSVKNKDYTWKGPFILINI